MKRTTPIDYELSFNSLSERDFTDMLVLHHTGNPYDDDCGAVEIHESHLGQGWAGIGYHFVIRKDGTVELGRPVDCIGSHAYGENSHTVGIHLCGNFEEAEPTAAQIESTAMLIADLAEDYNLEINTDTVVGHRDLMATACPGARLYAIIDIVRGKAIWYLQKPLHVELRTICSKS